MKRQAHSGFTLIELMITVMILAVIAAIAIPSYEKYVVKSHRAEAKEALLAAVVAEEKWRASHIQYTTTVSELNLSGITYSCTGCLTPTSYTESSYYTLEVPVATTTQFTVTATASNSAYPQSTKDTDCNTLSIDQDGTKTSVDSNGNASTRCW